MKGSPPDQAKPGRCRCAAQLVGNLGAWLAGNRELDNTVGYSFEDGEKVFHCPKALILIKAGACVSVQPGPSVISQRPGLVDLRVHNVEEVGRCDLPRRTHPLL